MFTFFCNVFSLRITLHAFQNDIFCSRPAEAKRKGSEGYDMVKNEK